MRMKTLNENWNNNAHTRENGKNNVTFKLRQFFTLRNSNILSNMCETS